MQTPRTIRNRVLAAAVFALVLAPAGVPAHAVSKDMIQLQTQVQQLLDMVQRLQSTLDTRFGGLQNLVQQTADEANQMTAAVADLQKKLNAQNDAVNGKMDATSGQIQSLNDSVDELKTRIDKLNQAIQGIQAQLQNIQSPPSTMPGSTPTQGGDTSQPGGSPQQPGIFPPPPGQSGNAPAALPAASQTPPLQETFQAAVRDYNAARYPLAASEFGDVVHYYPLDDLAGTAQFYLGEIAYQQQDYAKAINYYNAVLEGFSGNAKAPAAQLHKGEALLAQNKREAGIRELRLLIQRHPQTPEATRARSKLNGMGVRVTATASH